MLNNPTEDVSASLISTQVASISKRTLLVYWLPVLLMLTIIGIESFVLSSAETGGVLLRLADWISNIFRGHGVDRASFEKIHGILRKAGHVVGYGMLCALSFRALRGTARAQLSRMGSGWDWFWRWAWVGYALLITIFVAAADELHQTMLPSRTGSFRDVLIDGSGALLALLLIYAFARQALVRQSRGD